MSVGRIRSIKPEIHDDEPACSLDDDAWRLWVGAWPLADDEGRFRAQPLYLSTRLWMGTPTSDGRPRDALYAATALLKVASAGFVRLYRVNGCGDLYAEVKPHAWKDHQRIDHPSKWRNPKPSETDYLDPLPREPSLLLASPREPSPSRARALDLDSGSGNGNGNGSLRGVAVHPHATADGGQGGGQGQDGSGGQAGAEDAPGPPQRSTATPKRPRVSKSDPERFGPLSETCLQLAWRCWAETYQASRRPYGEYTRDPADGKRMVSLAKHGLELARERAAKLPAGTDVGVVLDGLFRFWFRAYLRDDGSKTFSTVEVKHGLRWLTNVSRYGSPWAIPAPRRHPGGPMVAPTPETSGPEPGAVGPPPEFLDALRRIGRGPALATSAPVDLAARRAELQAQAAALAAVAEPKAAE